MGKKKKKKTGQTRDTDFLMRNVPPTLYNGNLQYYRQPVKISSIISEIGHPLMGYYIKKK